jgi:hypothetical protein
MDTAHSAPYAPPDGGYGGGGYGYGGAGAAGAGAP